MSERLKTISETAFNITKILAVIVAGAWTYYQWDKVIFPKEATIQDAQAALDRVDVALGFSEMTVTDFGPPSDAEGESVAAILEVSGVIEFVNERPYPITLLPVATSVRMREGIVPEGETGLTQLKFKNEQKVELNASEVFGEFIGETGLVLERDGRATLAFRVPLLLGGQYVRATKELVFAADFKITAIDQKTGAPDLKNTKMKSTYAALLDVANTPGRRPSVARPPAPERAVRPAAPAHGAAAAPTAKGTRSFNSLGSGVFR